MVHFPMKEFLFPHKLRRLNYFVRDLTFEAILYFSPANFEPGKLSFDGDWPLTGLLGIWLVYCAIFVILPRMRDSGTPSWLVVLAFIPYVNVLFGLALLFKPSSIFPSASRVTPETPSITSVAGSICASCGTRLLFANDGVITTDQSVLCNSCNESHASLEEAQDSFRHRLPENVPGKYYVTKHCMDCDLCRETAPAIFARHDPGGYSYVRTQPRTPEEVALMSECVHGCCMGAIHDDGDTFDWQAVPAETPDHLTPEGQALEQRLSEQKSSSCCHDRTGHK